MLQVREHLLVEPPGVMRADDFPAKSHMLLPIFFGNFTSGTYDTRFAAPMLTGVFWNQMLPNGTDVTVGIRSSDEPSMAKPNPWQTLQNGHTAWSDYREDLEWTLPDGDGQTTVYAKFRDANGWESEITSSTILLDTTPPAGNITINGDAFSTGTAEVKLTIDIWDLLGVSGMRPSNDIDFWGAEWMPCLNSTVWTLPAGQSNPQAPGRRRRRSPGPPGIRSPRLRTAGTGRPICCGRLFPDRRRPGIPRGPPARPKPPEGPWIPPAS